MEGWVSDPSFNRAAASERCSKLYNLQSNGRWLKPESLKLKPPGAMRDVPHPTLKRLNFFYKHAPDGQRPEQADATPVAPKSNLIRCRDGQHKLARDRAAANESKRWT